MQQPGALSCPAWSLDDVRLPLYANVLQGICLAVPAREEHHGCWNDLLSSPQMSAQAVGSALHPRPSWLLPAVPVVEEELLSRLDGPLGKDPYPVVSVHHHHCNQKDSIRDVQLQLRPGSQHICSACPPPGGTQAPAQQKWVLPMEPQLPSSSQLSSQGQGHHSAE